MRTLLITLAIVIAGIAAQAQSQTYTNNMKAGYYNGNVQGGIKSTSITWTVKNMGNGSYTIKYGPCYNNDCGIRVKYSYTDDSGMYVYKPTGSGRWDGGGYVMAVLSSGKLSDYANGLIYEGKNMLGILETDSMGYIYILNK